MKKWIPIIVVTLLVFVLVVYKVKMSHPEWIQWSTNVKNQAINSIASQEIKNDHPGDGKKQSSAKGNQIKHRNHDLSQHFVFNTSAQKKLAKKYPDKFNIVKKMYYSWDNIHNAEGKFEWGNSEKNRTQNWFHVDLDNKRNRAKNAIYENGQVVQTINLLLKDGVITREMPNKHIFSREVIKDKKGVPSGYGLSQYSEIIQSQWYTLIYDDYTYWDYHIGMKFGMPVYKISGTIPNFISTDLAGRFTMTVSKKTGVLLGLKCYGHHDKPIYFVNVKNIKINQGIPDDTFRLDLSGNKRLSVQDFRSKTFGAQGGGTKK